MREWYSYIQQTLGLIVNYGEALYLSWWKLNSRQDIKKAANSYEGGFLYCESALHDTVGNGGKATAFMVFRIRVGGKNHSGNLEKLVARRSGKMCKSNASSFYTFPRKSP